MDSNSVGLGGCRACVPTGLSGTPMLTVCGPHVEQPEAQSAALQLGRQLPLSSDSAPSGDSDVADWGPLL